MGALVLLCRLLREGHASTSPGLARTECAVLRGNALRNSCSAMQIVSVLFSLKTLDFHCLVTLSVKGT